MFGQYRRFCLKTECKCQMQLSRSNLVQNNSERWVASRGKQFFPCKPIFYPSNLNNNLKSLKQLDFRPKYICYNLKDECPDVISFAYFIAVHVRVRVTVKCRSSRTQLQKLIHRITFFFYFKVCGFLKMFCNINMF